jgi:aryl-alcohol dehydrogenase-like predicted oxidoreductase
MELRKLGRTDLKIAPLVLGGNVFGWTADRETSFAVLDAFLDAGFNAIDTADVYNRFAEGLQGGESETVLGEWMKDRGVRDRVVLITKGGLSMGEGREGLTRDYLPRACEASLKRLQTDYIDVYMAHKSFAETPIEETLETFQGLIGAGKVRYAGCSNYAPQELAAALEAGEGPGRARYDVFEPHYNLADRHMYEGAPEQTCVRYGLGVIAYYALASGFLTGKYRSQADLAGSQRVRMVSQNLNPRGLALLDALDGVARRHGATPAQVALAWVMARPSVTAPIASATSVGQLRDILKSAELKLTAADVEALEACSAPAQASV